MDVKERLWMLMNTIGCCWRLMSKAEEVDDNLMKIYIKVKSFRIFKYMYTRIKARYARQILALAGGWVTSSVISNIIKPQSTPDIPPTYTKVPTTYPKVPSTYLKVPPTYPKVLPTYPKLSLTYPKVHPKYP